MTSFRLRGLCGLLLAASAAGCAQEQRYVVERDVQRMTESTPSFFITDDDEPLFRVQKRLSFPIEPPPDGYDFNMGRDPSPFPRLPWVTEGDVGYEIDWALVNQSDADVEVLFYLDGINEFAIYEPEPPEDFHQFEERFVVAPGERFSGTVRELEMSEIAIDLATVVNGAPNSNLVVYPGSHSQTDERIAQYIPSFVPGLVGVRAGIQTGEALPLRLTVSVRATDYGNRVPKRAHAEWELPNPSPFTPVVPE